MYRYSLAYKLFSGVCLSLIGSYFVVSGLNDEANPWDLSVGVFILLGAIGWFFTAYRQFQRRAMNP